MRKRNIALAFIFLLSALLAGAEIVVTSPRAGDNWCLGSTHLITWTKSGAMQATAAIRLRRAGSTEADPAALAIANGTANDGSYSWPIPNTVTPGDYFIRVRTDDSTVIGDSPTFKVSACVQPIQPSIVMTPMAAPRTLTQPVNFTSIKKSKQSYWWNCLAAAGIPAPEVLPSELLVGYSNHRVDRGVWCTDECVSVAFRGRPSLPDLMPLVGKNIIQATLSFRHKKTESSLPAWDMCLSRVFFYKSPIGGTDSPPYETRILPVATSGTYRIDVTTIVRDWLSERAPSFHGVMHNYSLQFAGVNETFECNNEKCLSWFDSGSLEVRYRD